MVTGYKRLKWSPACSRCLTSFSSTSAEGMGVLMTPKTQGPVTYISQVSQLNIKSLGACNHSSYVPVNYPPLSMVLADQR